MVICGHVFFRRASLIADVINSRSCLPRDIPNDSGGASRGCDEFFVHVRQELVCMHAV
jgi:hypothetical protein